MDFPQLLTATKSTTHFVLDPRCLCGDKPLAYFYRTEGMILFQSRDIAHRIVKVPRQSCINSTNIYPEHSVPPEFVSILVGDTHSRGYYQRTQKSLPYGK